MASREDAFDETAPADHAGVRGSGVAADAAVLAARRYQPLDELARGGAGRIVRARDLAFDRIVAIKEPLDPIHGGVRLRAEAAILAALQHPSIVPVFDAGTREDGSPFFAMKLIDGRSLRDVIKDAPTLVARLALIPQAVAVAEAMAYAHGQGVIHRDLKPANVLVGAFGETVVIDWGLAKVLGAEQVTVDGRGADRPGPQAPVTATTTTTGDVMGTPSYMAPEQARGEHVDARADVYALGAILYHLLAGTPPYFGRPNVDIIHTILTTEPDPIAELQPRAPADLVAIVTKAMAREAADRYPSAAQLADDLVRFQTGRLVSARRYSPIARSRRWLRRHRGVAAAIGLAAVSSGAAVALWPAAAAAPSEPACPVAAQRAHLDGVWDRGGRAATLRAAFEQTGKSYAADTFERVATRLDDYTEAWVASRIEVCEATRVTGEQSEALLDLRMACLDRRLVEAGKLVDVLGHETTAAMLDKAPDAVSRLTLLARCDDVAALQAVIAPPEDAGVRARVDDVRAQIAEVRALDQTGQYEAGRVLATTAAETATTLGYAPALAEALAWRAYLETHAGDSKSSEATLAQAIVAAGEAHDDALMVEIWGDWLNVVGYELGRPDDALAMLPAAEAAVRRADESPAVEGRLWLNVGKVMISAGRYADAKPYVERALALMEQELGPEDARVANALTVLAVALNAAGDYAGALAVQQRTLAVHERVFGPDHPLVASALNNIGEIQRGLDHLDEARAAHLRALEIRTVALGPEHPSTATTLHNLAIVERLEEHLDEAAGHFAKALEIREKVLGADHPDVADSLLGLGNTREGQGQLDEARGLYERALAIHTKALGADHPQLAYPLSNLGDLAVKQRRFEDARKVFVRAIALTVPAKGKDHPELGYHYLGLAEALIGLGRGREAHDAAARAVEIREAAKVPAELLADTRAVLARADTLARR